MKSVISLIISLFLSGCAASTHQDWTFMKSVGGISVVGQDKNPNWLIIRGDISGLKEFSTKPTHLNSALVVKSVKALIKDEKIQIYVVTTLAGKRYISTEINGVNISGTKKGTYMVQYLNPDNSAIDLKEVIIY